jgi:hypothetical protein
MFTVHLHNPISHTIDTEQAGSRHNNYKYVSHILDINLYTLYTLNT